MNKGELVEAVRRELGRDATRVEAERAVRAVLEAIGNGLRRDRNVQLIGFGTFKVSARGSHEGINPRNGELMTVAPSESVRFVVGKKLRNRL